MNYELLGMKHGNVNLFVVMESQLKTIHRYMMFILVILTTLLLYTGYWLALPGLRFYQTLKYIFCVAAPLLFITGRYSLAQLTEMRIIENVRISQQDDVDMNAENMAIGREKNGGKSQASSNSNAEVKNNTNANKGVIRHRK